MGLHWDSSAPGLGRWEREHDFSDLCRTSRKRSRADGWASPRREPPSVSALGGYEWHRLQPPAASAPQLTQGQVVGIFQVKRHGRLCPPFLRCLLPRKRGLEIFHPQPGGSNTSPGLSVLALSIPLGRGVAQRGDGPERPKDELSSPHLSPQGARPCADPRIQQASGDGPPDRTPEGDPIAVPEPDYNTGPRHPTHPGGVCALTCSMHGRAGRAGPH